MRVRADCRGKGGAAHGVPYRTVHVLLVFMGWAATVSGLSMV